MPQEKRTRSAESVLGAFIELHNEMTTRAVEKRDRINAYKAANPDQVDAPTVLTDEGIFLGQRDVIGSMHALIERLQAEMSGQTIIPGVTLETLQSNDSGNA